MGFGLNELAHRGRDGLHGPEARKIELSGSLSTHVGPTITRHTSHKKKEKKKQG